MFMTLSNDIALVLFSGGQDSTVCLAWALQRFARVETVAFDYGQRHAVELEVRPHLRSALAALNSDWRARGGGAPTVHDRTRPAPLPPRPRPPRHIVAGMCETDYSGYPDCRDDTVKAMQVALTLGLDRRVTLHTPLMWIDKADTFALAQEIGGQPLLDLVIEDSHSCYLGDRTQRHDWGYGCGSCPACQLRAQGFAKFMKQRKTT